MSDDAPKKPPYVVIHHTGDQRLPRYKFREKPKGHFVGMDPASGPDRTVGTVVAVDPQDPTLVTVKLDGVNLPQQFMDDMNKQIERLVLGDPPPAPPVPGQAAPGHHHVYVCDGCGEELGPILGPAPHETWVCQVCGNLARRHERPDPELDRDGAEAVRRLIRG